MKRTPRIPETEWEIMKGVWAEAPRSPGRSFELLTRTDPTWHPRTVKAFLTPFQRGVALRSRALNPFKGFPRRPASFPILESALGRGCASKRTVDAEGHSPHNRP
jgi:hypothetical protein